MKTTRFYIALLAALVLLPVACTQKATEQRVAELTNPLPMKFGDPFMLHASDGRYYMYGTSLGDGFEAYVSDSLTDWTPIGQVYKGEIGRAHV